MKSCDLLIRNGRVMPMVEPGQVLEGVSVAVVGQRIAAVGPEAEQYQAHNAIDATGRAVLPGLVNAHCHAPMTLFRGLANDRALMDWLQNYIFPAEAAEVNQEFVRWGSRLACLEMIQAGITTVADMYYFESTVAEEFAAAGLRGVLGQALVDFPVPDARSFEEGVANVRAFARDWKGHPLITPAVAPHAPYTVCEAHLRQSRQLADELELPLMTHLAETRTETEQMARDHQGLSPTAYLESIGFFGPRTLAAHVVWADEADIARLARARVGVAHCPHSNMKLASGVAPVLALLRAGVAVGLGTDGPASNNDLDPWQELQTAIFLQKVTALDPTALPAGQALQMATSLGARAVSLGHEVGTLEVGKKADLIIVSLDGAHQLPVYDVASTMAYTTRASDVRTVVIDGRVVMEERQVLSIQLEGLLDRVAEYADRIRKRVLH